MAGLYVVRDSRALVANTTKSLILVAPAANRAFRISEVSFSIGAIAADDSVAVELYVVTSLGSAAGTSFTPLAIKRSRSDTFEGTALINLTTEPTTVEVMKDWEVQPFGGLAVIQYPLGREPESAVGTANRWGLRYVNPTGGSTSNIRMSMEVED